MSIRVMTSVWLEAPYEGGALIVLLALADWADDAGNCFPKVPAIARKARLTERQVRNILKDFRKDGTISMVRGGGRGFPNRYRINTERFSVKSVSGKSEAESLKSATENPEICSTAKIGLGLVESIPCRQKQGGNRHYPSIEPSSSGNDSAVPGEGSLKGCQPKARNDHTVKLTPLQVAVALCQDSGWTSKDVVLALQGAIEHQASYMPEAESEQVGEWLVRAW